MDESNKKTLDSYEAGFNEYIQNTPKKRGAVVENWIDKSLEGLLSNAKILEIGSGDGRDAAIIEEKGFYVEKTDATKGFVDLLKESDPRAHSLNLLEDELGSEYELIIANAVLLHFTNVQTRLALKKVFDALKPNGVFSFTLKKGKGELWQVNKEMAPRFFNYWSSRAIVELLTDVGFKNINAWEDASDSSNANWIMVVAKKL